MKLVQGIARTVMLAAAAALTLPAAAKDSVPAPPDVRNKPITAYSYRIDEQGDTILVLMLNEITCFPPLKFKNKKEEEFYWKTVRDVRRTLPYAKLISETLIETYEYIETFATKKEREDYLKHMEDALFKQYKPVMKKFTRNQARTLVKLIQRETNQSSFDIVKAFLGGFRATFWQGFGKLFGVSLKSDYNPSKNRDDAIIERVATGIEQGWL